MPRPGGEADKFGNRYESLWVVDAALDLIDGEYADLVVEAVGDEAAGVEFYRTDHSCTREYHSIKRQQADGNWTISRLTHANPSTGRSILGDLILKVQEGAVGVFSSGSSASELDGLIQRANASESLEAFQKRIRGSGRLSGHFRDRIVPICNDTETSFVTLSHLRVRTRNERELIMDVERRVRSMFRKGDGSPVDAKSVRLLIAEFVIENLGVRLDSQSFISDLSDHNFRPSHLTGNVSVGQQMRYLNRRYLKEVNRLLINKAAISRRETASAYETLLEGGKSVMLEGVAGGGKSCVLAQVVKRLEDDGVPSLVIRLDRLNEGDYSTQAVGTRRGLPESPAITLGEFAGERKSVLCIDQLDALSIVSGRQQLAWSAFNELLDEARNYPNMRILFVCRSFDLERDAQLRASVTDPDQVERIPVEDLDEDVVKDAITKSGIDVSRLNDSHIRILSVPLHLYIYIEVATRSGDFDFASRGDLFDRFWQDKAQCVNDRLLGRSPDWTGAIAALCDAMSDRESLIAPEYVLDDCPDAIDAMASEGVVYIQDEYVRFFHESFFDYAFARTFLRKNKDLVQWLLASEQPLFRRSQVRQVLAFLRDREPDRSRYLHTLRNLLDNAGVRFHIKQQVLQWLGALSDPTEEEWTIVEGLVDQFGNHIWQVISNSVPWFDVLQEMGKWSSWLGANDHQTDMAVRLLRTPNVLNARSAVVAALVDPYREKSDQWRIRLRRLIEPGNGFTSPEMEDLVLKLIADGTLDDARPKVAMNDDWWSIWHRSSTQQPESTTRVIGAWFDRQIERAAEEGRDDPFSGSPELVAHSQFSGNIIKNCAANVPGEVVRELYPRFNSLESKAAQALLVAPMDLGKPDEQLRNGARPCNDFPRQKQSHRTRFHNGPRESQRDEVDDLARSSCLERQP